ncbi:MAG: MaoC family dehydratase [Betaproteobacteria bacterium]|nr:MaoC family dehydratase [Betaproteobacteria bacterium]
MINHFAELSGDHTWLHVDVERCRKESPFKTTIAHGFLLLSMLSRFNSLPDVTTLVTGYRHMMNYGSDRLRFLGAVPVDSEIHARSRIKEIEVSTKKTKMVAETHLHIVGQESAALVYEMMFVYL